MVQKCGSDGHHLNRTLALSTMAHFYRFRSHTMNDTTTKPALPDRLSGNSRSPFFVKECFEHQIGIRFNGKERTDVEEYCISEGWIKIPSPKAKDRYGNPMLIQLKGTVEAYYV